MNTIRCVVIVAFLAGAMFSFSFHASSSASARAQSTSASGPAIIEASQFADLQAAFDAVPQEGGLVRLPPGEFEITQPLILSRENVRVEGSGAATHLINRNEDGRPALLLRHADYPKDSKARIWRVQLADFRISGNPKSGDGLRAEGVNEIYLSGLSIDHNGGNGISLVDCYEDPRVSDSILTYNAKTGLEILRGHDIVVSANQFEENLDALRCIDSFNLCMTGNALDDHLRHGVVIENTYGSVLSGNMIEECRGTAIIIDRDCYGITVAANVIAHNFEGGVDLRDGWGCAISANTFTIVAKNAIKVGPESGRITITGNNFSNSHIGGRTRREEDYAAAWPRTVYASGVVLQETSDVAISGNIFTGLTHAAVTTEGDCRRVAISGNVMADLYRAQAGNGPAFDLRNTDGAIVGPNAVEKDFVAPQ